MSARPPQGPPDEGAGKDSEPGIEPADALLRETRLRDKRHRRSAVEGEPSTARYLAQIGVLGWMIVTPALLGLFLGRWLDGKFGSGLFCTAPMLLIGVGLGCWSGWKWMKKE